MYQRGKANECVSLSMRPSIITFPLFFFCFLLPLRFLFSLSLFFPFPLFRYIFLISLMCTACFLFCLCLSCFFSLALSLRSCGLSPLFPRSVPLQSLGTFLVDRLAGMRLVIQLFTFAGVVNIMTKKMKEARRGKFSLKGEQL